MLDRSAVITACLRFYKASDNYDAAQLLFENGFFEAANDRAFFCVFHAARALLAYDGLNYAMTDYMATVEIIKIFNDLYIRQRYQDPQLRVIFETARKTRQSGIYNRDFKATKEEAEQNIKNARYFLEKAQAISKRRLALEYDVPYSAAESDAVPFPFSIGSKHLSQ